MTPRSSPQVRIWWDSSISAYRLASPFNNDLVEALKKHIPVSDRSYDPTTKIWTLTEKYADGVCSLFKIMGIQYTIITRQQTEKAQSSGTQSPATAVAVSGLDLIMIAFVKSLPFEAAQSAYRKAAMLLHPDRGGGSMDAMSALNQAWTRLEKEFYKQ